MFSEYRSRVVQKATASSEPQILDIAEVTSEKDYPSIPPGYCLLLGFICPDACKSHCFYPSP